ncbi:hypothetical protein AVEN_160530-1 [Araneus ventricosus]|uniref:Uncharacterized protein n=1 Tax=Araneus ventricosus TaxID=182803 RepID=A0A4Y2PCD0_ARAVE|nr:hypothetical protein AVEN_160530-1 [Araneus ventricosus]
MSCRSDEGMEELTIPVTQRFITPMTLGQVFQLKAVQNARKMKFVTTGQNVVQIPEMQKLSTQATHAHDSPPEMSAPFKATPTNQKPLQPKHSMRIGC